jgi:hypothetical protein
MSLRDQFESDVKKVCMNRDDFAERGTYTQRGASTSSNLDGIFKDDFKASSIFDEEIANGEIVLICATVDCVGARTGATWRRLKTSTLYYVISAKPRTNGRTFLILSENNPLT